MKFEDYKKINDRKIHCFFLLLFLISALFKWWFCVIFGLFFRCIQIRFDFAKLFLLNDYGYRVVVVLYCSKIYVFTIPISCVVGDHWAACLLYNIAIMSYMYFFILFIRSLREFVAKLFISFNKYISYKNTPFFMFCH